MDASIFVPLIIFTAPVLLVLIVLRYRHAQTSARYQTLLQLAEKGVELAPQWLAEPRTSNADTERRRGVVLAFLGLGIMLTIAVLPGHFDDDVSVRSFWGIGLVPLLTGLGYLASWRLSLRSAAGG